MEKTKEKVVSGLRIHLLSFGFLDLAIAFQESIPGMQMRQQEEPL